MKGLILNDMGGDVMYVTENVTGTLREQMKHHEPIVCYASEEHEYNTSYALNPALQEEKGRQADS